MSTFIKTPKWIKNKKCAINLQNDNNKCCQYSVTLPLHHNKINSHPQRITWIKPFINNFNWKNINFPPTQPAFTCSKLTIETLEHGVKRAQY